MTPSQELLFGQAPRRVGTPNQHWVFAPGQVERFVDWVNGEANAYATMGWWDFEAIEARDDRPDHVPMIVDKVLYDLDSPAKAEEHEPGRWQIFEGPTAEEPPDDEVIERMRADPDLADAILGDVCEDARKLARRSRNDNVPVVGVFSGFGIHIHQLFQPAYDPSTAMATTAYRYIDRAEVFTPDEAILGQPERICRIPNCERVYDGRGCGLYTIPLTGAELTSVDVEWLLDASASPRTIDVPAAAERPEMRVWPDYETGHEETSDVPPRPLDADSDIGSDADVRWLVENLISMPCLVDRLLDDPNPDHDVRVYATILLLNVGLTPQTIINLYSQIRWIDWDREETTKQVNSIYNNGYSDPSCKTLRQKGLCVHSEEPEECPTFGWSGGQCEWKS